MAEHPDSSVEQAEDTVAPLPLEGRPRVTRSSSLDEQRPSLPNGNIGRPTLRHKHSLPTNLLDGAEELQRRGYFRAQRAMENADMETSDLDSIPDASEQASIIGSLDAECTCTYAVSRSWWKRWEDYAGITKNTAAGKTDPPGPIEMDVTNDSNNEYVNEEIWKLFMRWFGLSSTHHLDRKHLYFKDEKMFDICTLSPYSGIVEHAVKKFNRFEEIGYIECQLRRIFHISEYKKTRLWISEKAQVPRFRQLLLRFRMLNDCIHRDKMYILALEESSSGDNWPSGEPGEPKGDLNKYKDLVVGRQASDFWSNEISSSLSNMTLNVTESIMATAETFLENGKTLLKQREGQLERAIKTYNAKLDEVVAKENFLDEKAKEAVRQEELAKQEMAKLQKEREAHEAREARFNEELEHMKKMHALQGSKVKLDIGGHTFTTSVHTLQRDPDSMLAAMFSGRHALTPEADGSYFIDRDGTYFRFILNFLRDDNIEVGSSHLDQGILRELLREAKYYQMNRLVKYIEDRLQSTPR